MSNTTDAANNWQEPPGISGGMPVTLQMLSTGVGVGVGCGVGVGFLSPINLSAVPVLGQAAQGMSAGLGGVSSWLRAAGTSARQAARGLGVPGLDVGAGCGVLAGYYFGAGVMVKPSVVDQVARATTQLAGRLSHAISQKLQPGAADPTTSSSSTSSSAIPSTLQLPQAQQQHPGVQPGQPAAPAHTSPAAGISHPASTNPAAAFLQGMVPTLPSTQQQQQQQQQQHQHQQLAGAESWQQQGPAGQQMLQGVQSIGALQQQQADPVMTRLLLQQQSDIAMLKKQNRQLRAAVCKIDPSAAVCRGWQEGGSSWSKRGRASGRVQGLGDSRLSDGDVWSD